MPLRLDMDRVGGVHRIDSESDHVGSEHKNCGLNSDKRQLKKQGVLKFLNQFLPPNIPRFFIARV
jgi:hypothetical protein